MFRNFVELCAKLIVVLKYIQKMITKDQVMLKDLAKTVDNPFNQFLMFILKEARSMHLKDTAYYSLAICCFEIDRAYEIFLYKTNTLECTLKIQVACGTFRGTALKSQACIRFSLLTFWRG